MWYMVVKFTCNQMTMERLHSFVNPTLNGKTNRRVHTIQLINKNFIVEILSL